MEASEGVSQRILKQGHFICGRKLYIIWKTPPGMLLCSSRAGTPSHETSKDHAFIPPMMRWALSESNYKTVWSWRQSIVRWKWCIHLRSRAGCNRAHMNHRNRHPRNTSSSAAVFTALCLSLLELIPHGKGDLYYQLIEKVKLDSQITWLNMLIKAKEYTVCTVQPYSLMALRDRSEEKSCYWEELWAKCLTIHFV